MPQQIGGLNPKFALKAFSEFLKNDYDIPINDLYKLAKALDRTQKSLPSTSFEEIVNTYKKFKNPEKQKYNTLQRIKATQEFDKFVESLDLLTDDEINSENESESET